MASSAWDSDYLAALTARDEVERANDHVHDSYTRLADRMGRLNASGVQGRAPRPSGAATDAATEAATVAAAASPASQTQARSRDFDTTQGQIQQALALAQEARLELQGRLRAAVSEAAELRAQAQQASRSASGLRTDKTTLARRLRDRDEELRMKDKLLDDVQTEVVSLEMQLNMAEERARRLQDENEQLIARWMARVGLEAEQMNAKIDAS
ncbi:hypothetical protein KEM52_006567 [Ascosphaera acerosa]|nr:hypothetical protein KEM52_006567 [Ascosphaera acerosa]